MAFIYEEVGEENRGLWESIGWKDWGGNEFAYSKRRYWTINKDENAYLVAIGGYIDMPHYHDFSYEGRIVRMEVFYLAEGSIEVGMTFNWKIERMYIPKSLWSKKDDVIRLVEDAFSVTRNLVPIEKVVNINVEIQCEPECVEVDYNGR